MSVLKKSIGNMITLTVGEDGGERDPSLYCETDEYSCGEPINDDSESNSHGVLLYEELEEEMQSVLCLRQGLEF